MSNGLNECAEVESLKDREKNKIVRTKRWGYTAIAK